MKWFSSIANNGRGPNTNQNEGIPVAGDSGIGRQFDCNLLEWHENCTACDPSASIANALEPFVASQPPQTSVVAKGTPYSIRSANLFKPASAGAPSTAANAWSDLVFAEVKRSTDVHGPSVAGPVSTS